jgi:hypothetical protein
MALVAEEVGRPSRALVVVEAGHLTKQASTEVVVHCFVTAEEGRFCL